MPDLILGWFLPTRLVGVGGGMVVVMTKQALARTISPYAGGGG